MALFYGPFKLLLKKAGERACKGAVLVGEVAEPHTQDLVVGFSYFIEGGFKPCSNFFAKGME
ncbi:MAG: hypothetical protein DRP87_19635 [Spirochaetes bacterium]|nr:MAG: hypothetical protein DRP87_19635 [Spirochaetota bacterium]